VVVTNSSRIVLLTSLSLLSLVSGFFVLITPLPIALLFLQTKRSQAFLSLSIATFFLSLYSYFSEGTSLLMTGFYLLFVYIGYNVSKFLRPPWDGIPIESKLLNIHWFELWKTFFPLIIVLVIGFAGVVNRLGGWEESKNYLIKNIESSGIFKKTIEGLKKENIPETTLLLQKLENKPALAREILVLVPFYISSLLFFSAWLTLLLVLRVKSRRLFVLGDFEGVKKLEGVVLGYKNPLWLLYGVVVTLVLFLTKYFIVSSQWQEVIDSFELIGHGLMLTLGLFYFFQGFAVLLHLFNLWNIKGIFKSVFIFSWFFISLINPIMVFILPVLGLVDEWVDFRTKFKLKKIGLKD